LSTSSPDYLVTLTGGTAGTFNITNGANGTGTFTYNPVGDNAVLILTYTDAIGDSDTMNLVFTSGSAGTFSGSQVYLGAPVPNFTGT